MVKVKTKYMAKVEVDGEVWVARVEYTNRIRTFGTYRTKSKAIEFEMYPIKIEQSEFCVVETKDVDRRRACTEIKESTFRISKRKMDYFLSRADEWVHNALGKDLVINWV